MAGKMELLLSHLTLILSLTFLVFLVLDQFNPMMHFVNNTISQCLLGILCASGLGQGLLHWRSLGAAGREEK